MSLTWLLHISEIYHHYVSYRHLIMNDALY